MNAPLRVGSLFSGIGGFDLGLHRAGGFETVWFCEQDEFCQRVLAKHWPGVPCYPDIRELRGADVEPVDMLVGGSPCQDLSAAGLGAGLGGSRSGLWFEYLRVIREIEPRWVVVENVPPLRTRGLHIVLEGLASCGYDAEWDGISASAVGAHHQRDRIWIVAYSQRNELRDEQGRGGWTGRGQPPLPSDDGAPGLVAHATSVGGRSRDEEVEHSRAHGSELPSPDSLPCARESQSRLGRLADGFLPGLDGRWVEPDIPRVAEGVPNRRQRLTALGNALVPQIPEWIGQRIMTWEEQNG